MCFRIFSKNRTGNFELTSDVKKKFSGAVDDSLALNFAERITSNELSQIKENQPATEAPISIENKSLLNSTHEEKLENKVNKTSPPRHTNDNPRRKKIPKRRAPQPPINENKVTKRQVFVELDCVKNEKATEETDNRGLKSNTIKYNSTNINTNIEVEDNKVHKETHSSEHSPDTSTNSQEREVEKMAEVPLAVNNKESILLNEDSNSREKSEVKTQTDEEREVEKMAGVPLAINNKESILLNEDGNRIEKSEGKTQTDEEFSTAITIEQPLLQNANNNHLKENEIGTNGAREIPLGANNKFMTILGADSDIKEKNKVEIQTTEVDINIIEPAVSNTGSNIPPEMEDGRKSTEEAPYATAIEVTIPSNAVNNILDQRAFVRKPTEEPILGGNINEPVLSSADSNILEVISMLEEEAKTFQYKIEQLTEDAASNEKYYINESITRIILKLDNLDDSQNQAVTLKKKQLIKFTHNLFKRFDEKTGHT